MIKNTAQKFRTPTNSTMVFPIKNSTLCNSKEFFYEKTKPQTNITEEEYKEALTKTENIETIYFEMSNTERLIYNNNIRIIKQYLSQTK